ncbi:MAG: IMP dehydrogenase, partial [Ancrocorticia sp.]|nr:IMP dehydrogenase [Ancrocorticia sp.]
MSEVEIGRGKRARRAYTLDDVAVVASRRTRDVREVSTSWQFDAYHLDVPILSAPMDSVTSPASAIAIGKLGGVGVLDLEGLWTRYEDPEPLLEEISHLDDVQATLRMQEIYQEPVKPELLRERLRQIREADVTVAGALSPGRTQALWRTVV